MSPSLSSAYHRSSVAHHHQSTAIKAAYHHQPTAIKAAYHHQSTAMKAAYHHQSTAIKAAYHHQPTAIKAAYHHQSTAIKTPDTTVGRRPASTVSCCSESWSPMIFSRHLSGSHLPPYGSRAPSVPGRRSAEWSHQFSPVSDPRRLPWPSPAQPGPVRPEPPFAFTEGLQC